MIPCLCVTALLLAGQLPAQASDDITDIKAFLHDNFDKKNVGMVIGLVDEHGSRIFSAGKLDNGTDQEVDGDTVFEIGSITKTFTALLLQEMAERGEIKLTDPVAKYLPESVKVPSYNHQEITLLDLATQASGLPFQPDNTLTITNDWENPWVGYTAEKIYAFLSGYTLPNAPGAKFQYSNIGMAVLGHVLALKGGTNYESLVVDRICRPLHMDSTRVALTPALHSRLAIGHALGKPAPNWDIYAAVGAGGLRSTANDLLKYVSAELGLKPSKLTPLMKETQVIRHLDSPDFGKTAMPWYDQLSYNFPGMELLGHGGGTGGYSTFVGFDKKQRRGVVVVSNQRVIHSPAVGWRILQHAQLTDRNPAEMMPVREIEGIGTGLKLDEPTGALRITMVWSNSPAIKAGLKPGLTVQSINDIATAGKTLPECLDLIRGKAGAKLHFAVIDPERKQTNTVEMTREKFLIYQ
ncbi:MAG: putative Serine-type D-Ala-D-Ala carboxypeptidase [Pedosphaera sp.]|nr:putative Serine-type D-Ala-D-Ala carboxypeptidase [Pedosphaera sp.]